MIKSNIDLTANEIFSRSNPNNVITSSINKMLGEFPWNRKLTFIETEFEKPKYEPIFTGDSHDRYVKTLVEQENSGDYCDCCGAFLKVIPWDRTYGLCRKCIVDMEKNYGNTQTKLWMFDKEMRPDRAKISLRW